MPWQRSAVDVALEFDPDSRIFYYRSVIILVTRQSGKTVTETANMVDRSARSGKLAADGFYSERQRTIYSAQTGQDARKKLLEDVAPSLEGSPLRKMITKPHGNVIKANGAEQIRFSTGSLIEPFSSLEAAGHGFTVDLGKIDEAWKDIDARREQALLPAMSTRPQAQLWVVSTAGTGRSVYLANKRDIGRAAALEGPRPPGEGTCYIEYSLPEELVPAPNDPLDHDQLLQFLPALCPNPTPPCTCSDEWRHTQFIGMLRHARDSLRKDPGEFERAFLNVWQEGGGETVIPEPMWQSVIRADVSPRPPFTFGLAVLRELGEEGRQAACLVAHGSGVCEIPSRGAAGDRVWDHRPGTGWVVARVKEIKTELGPIAIAIDGSGPAAPVADDLEKAGIQVQRLSGPEYIAACGGMYDAIADDKIAFRAHPSFEAAFTGLARRPAGDRFVWDLSTSTEDVTPLSAATLARVATPPRKPIAMVT